MIVRQVTLAKTNEGGKQKEYWPWPQFSIHIAGPPEHNKKLYFKFVGTVEEITFDIILLGSVPSSRASSIPDTTSRHSLSTLNTIPESQQHIRGRYLLVYDTQTPTVKGLIRYEYTIHWLD